MQMVSVKLHSLKSTTNLWQTWEVYQDFPKTRYIGSHWRQSQTLLDFLSNPKRKQQNCDRQHTFMNIHFVPVNVMHSESVYCSLLSLFWGTYAGLFIFFQESSVMLPAWIYGALTCSEVCVFLAVSIQMVVSGLWHCTLSNGYQTSCYLLLQN